MGSAQVYLILTNDFNYKDLNRFAPAVGLFTYSAQTQCLAMEVESISLK